MSAPRFTVGGEAQQLMCLKYGPNSDVCQALARRYPGIRFNQVNVDVWHDWYMQHSPDEDSVRVLFNMSGSPDALKDHGFDQPIYCGSRMRTKSGVRISCARFTDGLDRVAHLLVPALLERFRQPQRAQP